MSEKRTCKVCKKKIEAKTEYEGSHNKFSRICSEEGVYFQDGKCWFCNDCWKEMTEDKQ